MDIAALNARFGIPGQVNVTETPAGFPVVEVANRAATATIALQGAHVMTWTPRGEKPVIWLSPAAKLAAGKSIRGGVPVCWPWFGPHATEASFPAHGFARTVPWELIEAEGTEGATRLCFRLCATDTTRAQWPHASELFLDLVIGKTLEIELVTRNTGNQAITVGQALHTYFAIGDVRRIAIQGLDDCPYIDKVDGGARKRQTGPVTIAGEVDRIYLQAPRECVIEDSVWQRRVRIAKRGSRSTVVWNPWSEKAAKMGDLGENGYLGMVCVESANAADDAVTVSAGGEHRLAVQYAVETLS